MAQIKRPESLKNALPTLVSTEAANLCMAQQESTKHPSPRCDSCVFVMPSETSPSGLRCGHQYFMASPLLRKFTRMENYPVVKDSNACEAWTVNLNQPLNL
jgi:hypothetical protein